MKIVKIIFTAILIFTNSCTLAPTYKRPQPNLPFGEIKQENSKIAWQNFFQSEDLKRLIALALKNNNDLKIAHLNIESARALHSVARADLMPKINATSSFTRQGVSGPFANFTPETIYRANINFTSYEIDFFGRIQSLKKAALEDFLASREAKNLLQISLISEVANSYAQLVLDNQILAINQEILQNLEEKEKLMLIREEKGFSSKTDLLNAFAATENARTNYENYQKIVAQDQNAIFILINNFDEKNLPQAQHIADIKIDETALEFVASKNLLSRYDIRQAEHKLKKANANIGAARAAFFPSISLTSAYGYQSIKAANLSDSKTWSIAPQINLPLFSGGKNSANLDNAKALKEIEIIQYQKTIQNAFREASNKLAERKALISQRQSANKIFEAKKSIDKMSKAKQKHGLINKLDLINYHLELLTAKQNQLTMQKNYLANLIELYKVLGGGSEIESE